MSGKGGKRISVFDRLGPGNDEEGHVSIQYVFYNSRTNKYIPTLKTNSTHRRVSTDKPSEKRHSVSGRTR